MTEGKGNKVAWGAIIVALIAGLSGNVQTWLSTAGKRADEANENIHALIKSMDKQLNFNDKQIVELAKDLDNIKSDLNTTSEHTEEAITEIRQMLFTMALQSVKTNKRTEERLEKAIVETTKKPAAKGKRKPAKETVTKIQMVQSQRPKWPPELVQQKAE